MDSNLQKLVSDERITDWEDFVSTWKVLQETEMEIQWAKGDLANKLVIKFGDRSLSKFAQEVGESETTLQHYRRVARAFPNQSDRKRNLPWSSFLVSSFSDSFNKGDMQFESDNRHDWLDKAEDRGWGVQDLKRQIKEAGQKEDGMKMVDVVTQDVELFCSRTLKREPDELKPSEWKEVIERLEKLCTDLYTRAQSY